MDFLWDKITEWLKEMLIGGIVSNLSGMFDATNQKVAEISGQVGLSPQAWNGSIFSMIQNLSETVIVPIAGAILAFVMTLELIQLITDKNNLNDMDTWIFFKWAFKSAAAVLIVTNTWTIVMGVFDAAQSVVASASGLIIGDTSIDISNAMSIPANPDAWGTDRNCYLAVNSHPGLVDLFLSQTRKAYAQEQQKTSVRDKLKKPPETTSPKISAKSKAPER